jgi:tRNA-dihydrouridine synthase B
VTVKVRSGLEPGERQGFELAQRLVAEAGVAAIGFHPRAAATQHKGVPDYEMARELAASLEAPMIISGGLDTSEAARRAYEESGADAVMIARGSLGNPWIFEELTGKRDVPADRGEIVAELLWVIDRAEEHLGPERAARYLRKFYPWYLERLGTEKEIAATLQESDDLGEARRIVSGLRATAPVGA